jgi:hypothetical protein
MSFARFLRMAEEIGDCPVHAHTLIERLGAPLVAELRGLGLLVAAGYRAEGGLPFLDPPVPLSFSSGEGKGGCTLWLPDHVADALAPKAPGGGRAGPPGGSRRSHRSDDLKRSVLPIWRAQVAPQRMERRFASRLS